MRVLKISSGNSSAEIYTYGATVTSWREKGVEKLFLSKTAKLDGSKAIRGGIPVVFPNFGPWKLGPQHGFARISNWEVLEEKEDFVILTLSDNKETRQMWDFGFTLQYTVRIENNKLYTILTVKNTDEKEFDFTALLHTYFKVDVSTLEVTGFKGETYADKLKGVTVVEDRDVVKITENVDSVYQKVEKLQMVKSSLGCVEVRRQGLPDVVFWNPWEEKAKAMGDFDDLGYHEMVCVEPGYVSERKILKPGEQWTGSQWLCCK